MTPISFLTTFTPARHKNEKSKNYFILFIYGQYYDVNGAASKLFQYRWQRVKHSHIDF